MDKLNLFIKIWKTKKKSKKFNYIKVELFFIKIKKRIVSYKLVLTNNTEVYPIFYILPLKLAGS